MNETPITVSPLTVNCTGDHGLSATGTAFDYYTHHFGGQCYSCAARTYTGTPIWLTQLPAEPPRLSDADVKRIAREVVRQMQAIGHDPGDEDR